MNNRAQTMLMPEFEVFLTYVRTLQHKGLRFRGQDDLQSIYISQKEIKQRFFKYPRFDYKMALRELIELGELAIEEFLSKKGRKNYKYSALNPGRIDLSLLPQPKSPKNSIHLAMIDHLKAVSYPTEKETTTYFDWFLNNVKQYPFQFFKVDKFASRIHTPITNLHRPLRPSILLQGSPTISFDVVTMQPLLLGKILLEKLGPNEYSTWINEGVDIYIKLQEKAGLATREEAKKRFFEILFSQPSNKLTVMFGASPWIRWINDFKRLKLKQNPSNKEKPYSNLSWLLQNTEVSLMKKVWVALFIAKIPFLTVHDEIIVKEQDGAHAKYLFSEVLEQEFVYYKLNNKS